MFFAYIRAKVRDSVLAGLSDAVAEIERGDADGVPEALASLRGRLQALPAPEPEPAGKRRKGE
jgi:hypothetical protein